MSSFKLSSLFDTSHSLIDFGDLSQACLFLQSTLAKNGILSLCARNGDDEVGFAVFCQKLQMTINLSWKLRLLVNGARAIYLLCRTHSLIIMIRRFRLVAAYLLWPGIILKEDCHSGLYFIYKNITMTAFFKALSPS